MAQILLVSIYMMTRIHIYFLIALALGSVAYAKDQTPSRYENTVLTMINAARQNPLAIAASLGMDTHKIISDFPEMSDIFKNGLPPLMFNSKLYQSASLHAQDMMDKKYYSAISLDKKSVQERILDTGYIPIISGESLGMLSFGNFMDPDKAAKAVFHNMFADELDPARSEKRNILNPDIKDIGISFKADVFDFDGSRENVYLAVCDFGNSDSTRLESSLLTMINEVPKAPPIPEEKPIKTGAGAAVSMTDSSAIMAGASSPPVPQYQFPNQFPNLAVNEKLTEAARKHTQDIIERLYFDNISPEGTGPFYRAMAAGYKAVSVIEVLAAIEFDHFLDPTEAVRIFYEYIINNALLEKGNIEIRNFGMNIELMTMNVDKNKTRKLYILTAEFGNDSSVFSPAGVREVYHKFYKFVENSDT